MAHKFALFFVIVALVSVANATLTTSAFTSASFNVTPVAVVNSTDTIFYNTVIASSVAFGPGADNTTNYMYGYGTPTGSATPYVYTIKRRKLNSTTQASLGDESLTGASCDTATESSFVAGGQGAYALACVLTSTTNSNTDIWLYSWTPTTTAAKATKVSAEAASTSNTLTVEELFYDSGAMMWYVIFRQAATTYTLNVYIQAVNVSNGTAAIVYAAGGVAVITGGASVSSTGITDIQCSLNNVTNATTASLVYKDSTSATIVVKLIPVTLSTGAPGSAVTLGTDLTTTDSSSNEKTVVNLPAGLGSSYSTYLAGVFQTETNLPSGGSATPTQKIFIFYNGSSTSTENYTVASTYNTGAIGGSQYGSGYTIFQILTSSTTGTLIQYLNYFGNGSYNASSTATSVGTFGGEFDMWLDANGALWVGAANSDSSPTDTALSANMVQDASIGKLFGQVYLFANTLSSVFAFVTLMIAALFAF